MQNILKLKSIHSKHGVKLKFANLLSFTFVILVIYNGNVNEILSSITHLWYTSVGHLWHTSGHLDIYFIVLNLFDIIHSESQQWGFHIWIHPGECSVYKVFPIFYNDFSKSEDRRRFSWIWTWKMFIRQKYKQQWDKLYIQNVLHRETLTKEQEPSKDTMYMKCWHLGSTNLAYATKTKTPHCAKRLLDIRGAQIIDIEWMEKKTVV